MVRVTAIPYLNTTPFVYGLKQKAFNHIDLSFATPAIAAHQLQNNLCDIAIVPVATIPALPWYKIVGNYCIGAVSEVASVLLCSRVPVAHIKEVALDSESRTSVRLAQLLLRDYWHVTPRYVPLHSAALPKNSALQPPVAPPLNSIFQPVEPPSNSILPPVAPPPNSILPPVAPPQNFILPPVAPPPNSESPESVVLIGDKALLYGTTYPYVYDLATHWIRWTGKPFVFAVWLANKPLPTDFAEIFTNALAYGVSHIDNAIASEVNEAEFPAPFAKTYLTQNISYVLDNDKYEGLKIFLDKIIAF